VDSPIEELAASVTSSAAAGPSSATPMLVEWRGKLAELTQQLQGGLDEMRKVQARDNIVAKMSAAECNSLDKALEFVEVDFISTFEAPGAQIDLILQQVTAFMGDIEHTFQAEQAQKSAEAQSSQAALNRVVDAVKNFRSVKEMLNQGMKFHMQFTDILNGFKREVSDFAMGRDLQASELATSLGGASPSPGAAAFRPPPPTGPPPGQAPQYAPPPAYGGHAPAYNGAAAAPQYGAPPPGYGARAPPPPPPGAFQN